jgi:hypothetical protein
MGISEPRNLNRYAAFDEKGISGFAAQYRMTRRQTGPTAVVRRGAALLVLLAVEGE